MEARVTMTNDRQDRIRNRAHKIWLEEGQPAGHHERHWHQAAADVEHEDAAGVSKGKKPARKAAAAGSTQAAPKKAKAATKAPKAASGKSKKADK
jgi:hypothetical protein